MAEIPAHPMDGGQGDGAGAGELYRGWLGEVVRDAGPGRLTCWLLAWRCKRCAHCWPVSAKQRTMAERGAERRRRAREAAWAAGRLVGPLPPPSTVDAGSLQERGEWMPRKCPACKTRLWWKDYVQPLDGPGRRGRVRQPAMLKTWRDRTGATLRRPRPVENAPEGDAGSSEGEQ